jgi:DNA-binding transcriptional LysR family regulator
VISEDKYFYVPSMEYKIRAQIAGIGCGFLPRFRIQEFLKKGQLIELQITPARPVVPLYLAWKVVNQGKALKRLREMLITNKALIKC